MIERNGAFSVVIAEDDELTAELLIHRLEQENIATKHATDGQAALTLIKQLKPDAVILDGMMPSMDGFEVLRRMKLDDTTKDIPVMLLTARDMEQDVVSGLSLGADEYVTKPFMLNELVTRLQRLFRA